MPHRVAIITDIHGNLPALEAALAAIEQHRCEIIYCLGDVIGIGPFPAECLHMLLQRSDVRFVMGNHDAWFAHSLPSPQPASMSDDEIAHHRWVHAQLDPDVRPIVAQWPWFRIEQIGSLQVTFLHYPRNNAGDDFAPIEPTNEPAVFDALFAAHRTPLVFFGHHHPTADVNGGSRYINPGSLGCAHDALARFCTVDVTPDRSYTVAFHAVPYDRQPVFRAFVEREVPEREMITRAFFGQPPSHVPTIDNVLKTSDPDR